jgi:hypothetical protein
MRHAAADAAAAADAGPTGWHPSWRLPQHLLIVSIMSSRMRTRLDSRCAYKRDDAVEDSRHCWSEARPITSSRQVTCLTVTIGSSPGR